jgi:hypothetical protein
MTPKRLARAIEGRAPAACAARSHRIQASDPVTKRFGPTFNPTRRANGCRGTRAANSDAAGRLLKTAAAPAATAAVAHRLRCESSVAGPDQARPAVPSATDMPNRPTRTGMAQDLADPLWLLGAAPDPDTSDRDAGHRDRDRRGSQHDNRGCRHDHAGEPQAEDRPARLSDLGDDGTQPPPLENGDYGRGDQDRRHRRRPHLGQEVSTAEMQVTQHDQVGQVRAGQRERRRVGQE